MNKKIHNIQLRVRYGETDQMGVCYYAEYFEWFEVARTEFLRNLGLPYTEFEKKGIFLPVKAAYCEYKSPVKYDDLVNIKIELLEKGNSSVSFKYEITCQDRLVALGKTTHVFVDKNFKPNRIPPELEKSLL